MPKYFKVIKIKSGWETRFVVANAEGEIIDDAQGHGFKRIESAVACIKYKWQFGLSKKGYGRQTDIGKVFGKSSIEIGKKLEELGLKGADKKPTPMALERELAKTSEKNGFEFYLWHVDTVAELISQSGLSRLRAYQQQIF